jgi:hypothetical protein
MRPFFAALSVGYISGIFLLADSSIVSGMAKYNPYSLLHIPLYGILTGLIVLCLLPFKGIRFENRIRITPDDLAKTNNLGGFTFRIDPVGKINPTARLLIAGFIAAWVAIADELHQSFIASRDGSITDIFLDIVGISFVILFVHKLCRNRF